MNIIVVEDIIPTLEAVSSQFILEVNKSAGILS